MAKTITFEFEGRKYTLGFNRKTVRQMENEGFNLEDVKNKPLVNITMLFAGAFRLHHKYVKPEQIDKMQGLFRDKAKLNEALMEMYSETVTSVMASEEEEDESENLISWSLSE
ncbi:MAG: DUF5055 domain-containing protein [Porcipelethomonas sp.]